ncbi:hypothetical protein PFICI_05751 [Pestalotiopsis fici W106-1]|uniref:FAD-binding FR-type domain-containing protein n=1 Tax=Pestalotiopsis fici (strain W106-1 / CGMCC3.15140) TaxID=1229662 RepID=W3XCT6_PESFW|nr:uncharacterized protein PFICI_05751 [Pestalotiopsis fici W106-1]ETS83875.1 hypothetical protein PFICI_05751 [Pestalotiopsis fici W106-1]
MALCVFFGFKNTPLAAFVHTSHTQLNIFHRIVGYATIFLVFLHAIFYTIHFGRQGRWETLLEEGNLQGIGAGIAFLILLMAIFRHQGYEIFYVSHIVGFIASVVLVTFHRPKWSGKLPVVMIFIALIWTLDRAIRTARMYSNLVNNSATFYPLPDGGTRVILKKPGAQIGLPGSHCFLWIPRIHLFGNHPFTIVSNGPSGLELVMKSHEGFTKAVNTFATLYPGRCTWASIDGPYGTLADTRDYDKLIMIAGGSGAAFTFGLLNRIIDQSKMAKVQSIEFIWTIRHIEHMSWFHESLHHLANSGLPVLITVYVTGHEPPAERDIAANTYEVCHETQIGTQSSLVSDRSTARYGTFQQADMLAKFLAGPADDGFAELHNIKIGRMDIEVVIGESLQTLDSQSRVLVTACGPRSLMDAVRDSADKWRDKSEVALQVHCEAFDSG